MASHASSVVTMSQARQPGQLPASARPGRADPAAAGPDDNRAPRPLEVAQCSLCGITRPLGLLVPDGGRACADIRWYCKDVKSCTERWSTATQRRRTVVPVTPPDTVEATAEPAPAEAPAEQAGPPAEAEPASVSAPG